WRSFVVAPVGAAPAGQAIEEPAEAGDREQGPHHRGALLDVGEKQVSGHGGHGRGGRRPSASAVTRNFGIHVLWTTIIGAGIRDRPGGATLKVLWGRQWRTGRFPPGRAPGRCSTSRSRSWRSAARWH